MRILALVSVIGGVEADIVKQREPVALAVDVVSVKMLRYVCDLYRCVLGVTTRRWLYLW